MAIGKWQLAISKALWPLALGSSNSKTVEVTALFTESMHFIGCEIAGDRAPDRGPRHALVFGAARVARTNPSALPFGYSGVAQ